MFFIIRRWFLGGRWIKRLSLLGIFNSRAININSIMKNIQKPFCWSCKRCSTLIWMKH
jgi:hypothetical protein